MSRTADSADARLRQRAGSLAGEAIELLSAASGAEPALSAEAVHRLRVISKSLRAAWQLLAPTLGREAFRGPERELRDAARMLAGPRDAHVLQRTVTRLVRRHGDRVRVAPDALPAPEAMELLCDLVRERFPEEETACDPRSLRVVFTHQARAIDGWLSQPDEHWLVAGLLRSYRRALGAGRRAQDRHLAAQARDEAWHRCRRWVKYELYQLELLSARSRPGRRRRRLAKFGDRLGRFHDLCELQALVADALPRLQGAGAEPAVLAILEREERPLRRRLRRDFRRLYHRSPGARRRRLERRWRR